MDAQFQQLVQIVKACEIPSSVVAHIFGVSWPIYKRWVRGIEEFPQDLVEAARLLTEVFQEAKAKGKLPMKRAELMLQGLHRVTESSEAGM